MSIQELLVVVAVSVEVSSDYTKMSVITVASDCDIKFEKFNVAFPTDSIKDLGPVLWSEEQQIRDEKFKDLGYRFLNSRDLTVNLLSDYLKLRVFCEVEKAINNGVPVLNNCIVKYQLLTDYSQGPKRFSDSICIIADALSTDAYRSWIIDSLGSPVILNDISFEKRLQDPINHCKKMILHNLAR